MLTVMLTVMLTAKFQRGLLAVLSRERDMRSSAVAKQRTRKPILRGGNRNMDPTISGGNPNGNDASKTS